VLNIKNALLKSDMKEEMACQETHMLDQTQIGITACLVSGSDLRHTIVYGSIESSSVLSIDTDTLYFINFAVT
jgi:hypothetical protein